MKNAQERFRKRIFVLCLAVVATSLALGAAQTQTQAQGKPAAKTPVAANAADVPAGKKVFAEQCDACHFANSTAKKVGPGLKGIYKRGKFASGKPVNDEAMRLWIQNGGKDMPAFKDNITPEELREVIAYLHTI
jgi:cytochrome c